MDGIGLPILALLFGAVSYLFCRRTPFALAAFLSPFVSSVVLLFGSWILSDMNPCVEYGSSCVPKGAHDLELSLLLLSVPLTFALSAVICFKIQKALSSR